MSWHLAHRATQLTQTHKDSQLIFKDGDTHPTHHLRVNTHMWALTCGMDKLATVCLCMGFIFKVSKDRTLGVLKMCVAGVKQQAYNLAIGSLIVIIFPLGNVMAPDTQSYTTYPNTQGLSARFQRW